MVLLQTDMGEENNKQPVLKKKQYHENCPGCKVDQAKEMKTDVSIRNLLNIWMIVLCSALPIASLFPYLYFMVGDFHIAKREEDISSYAGYVGSAFMIGRALTSIFWGMISDRYGRKPVMMVGIISVIIFNTLFSLSTNFWMAITLRFLLGSLNGLLGPMKAYSVELFREEKQALGLSTVSSAWGIGLVIGPALGGYFAQPVVKYPKMFLKNSLWDKFPYFLPSLIISVFAFMVLIASIWLPETLHNHPHRDESDDYAESLETGSNGHDKDKTVQKDETLLLNWPLMSSIIIYCIISLHDIAFQEVCALWSVSPRKLGGLNFKTNDVGDILAITGIGLIIYQLCLYPRLEKVFGPLRLARIAGVLSIPVLQSCPFIALLSGVTLFLVLNIASILKNLLTISVITGLFLLQNRAVEQHQRGAANGISMAAVSVFKAIGPAAGGAVLSWSQKKWMNASFLPGTHMVFFILNVVMGFGVLLMFTRFLRVRKNVPSH